MILSTKKIFAIALCCAGLYAAVLGGMAIAQDPASYAADTAVGGDKGALVLLHQNDSVTGRAQSVPIAGTSVATAP